MTNHTAPTVPLRPIKYDFETVTVKAPRPFFSNRKVGGIRFVRVGKLSLSFCVSK